MSNRISVILDVATEKGTAALKGFKQSVAEADGAFGKLKAGGSSAFATVKQNAGLAGVAVVGAVGAMAAKSIEAASRLGESVNAVNVTFGESAAGIKDLGEQAAESVGLSNAAFNGLAVQFSSFATTIAGEGGDVVSTIGEMTTRAADFASVMNVDVADAAAMFQSGLAGETEPLKKFGIDLSAAAVEAFALSEGIIESGESMTEAQKVQARYGLLMKQTNKTAGDFANTSTGLANSQRILAAKMENTAAKVGKNLAPALATVTTMMSDMIPVAGSAASAVGSAFTKMADAAYDFGGALVTTFDKIPGVTMDVGDMIGPTLQEWEKLERANADLVAQFAAGTPTLAKFQEAMRAAGKTTEEVNLATIEYAKQLDGTSEIIDTAVVSLDSYDERTQTATSSTASLALAEENAAKKAEDQAEALADLTQKMIDAVGRSFDLEQSTLDLTSAYADYEVKLLDNMAVQGDAEISDRDKEQSARDLRSAELDTAAAALDTALAFADESGAARDSTESAQLQKEKLQELQRTFPELYDEIQVYIDKLNDVPGVIRTRFEITATGATVTPHGDFIGLNPGNNQAVHNAMGGPTRAGGFYEVNELGSELLTERGRTYLLAGVDGYITPHSAISAGWPSAGSASAGGSMFPETVTLIVEGEPITARIARHDRQLASSMRAGRR